MKRLASLLTAVLLVCASLTAAQPTWEEVTSPHPTVVQALDMDSQIEVTVFDGYIYIWSSRPVTVRLFSILGQQIHQENVAAGLHRLRLNSKGIYILRAGSLTTRVTI